MVEVLVNELEEFKAFTEFPVYKADNRDDTGYMGHFVFPMFYKMMGFRYILTLLARGYLFRDGSNGYDRIGVARRALLAWCSVSEPKTKKAPAPNDPGLRVSFGEYAAEFPELVTPEGKGWLIRHVENIIRFVEANHTAVRKNVPEKVQALNAGFRGQWANKVRQMQIPLFATNTLGAWDLRLDDILADALELGPLRSKDFELDDDTIRRLTELTPDDVPIEASILLYKYYVVNRTDDRAFVELPQQNFNAWFGTTSFSQKWTAALNGTLIEKKTIDGVSKYRLFYPPLIETGVLSK